MNESRRLLHELYHLRKADEPPVTGAETLGITVAYASMPKEQFNNDLRGLLTRLDTRVAVQGYRKRLFLYGSELDDPDWVKVIEGEGGLVVADGLCFGARMFWDLVDESSSTTIVSLDFASVPAMDVDSSSVDLSGKTLTNDLKVSASGGSSGSGGNPVYIGGQAGVTFEVGLSDLLATEASAQLPATDIEMDEIADTFDAVGIPGDFHDGATKIYRRTAHFKEPPAPKLEDVLSALTETESDIES